MACSILRFTLRAFSPLFIFLTLKAPTIHAAGSSEISELSRLVAASFCTQEKGGSDLKIEQIVEWDRNLKIRSVSGEDHVVIKYMLSHWRMWTQQYIIQSVETARFSFRWALEQLLSLEYTLDGQAIARLHKLFLSLSPTERESRDIKINYAELLAIGGDPKEIRGILRDLDVPEASLLAGPVRVLDIPPMDPSGYWRSHRWLGLQGMADYFQVPQGIRYRGYLIREGDLLLVDLNKIFDGINTSFSSPRSSFTHNGIVVFLEYQGQKIPAVFEIHAAGLRMVPLNRYLSPDFTSYVEIFRREDTSLLTENWSSELSRLVHRMLEEQMGYDFNAQPIPEGGYEAMIQNGQRCVVCSSLADLLDKSLGVSLPIPSSTLHEGARKNVGALGLTALSERGTYLTPTDLKFTPGLYKVGTIDNGFTRNFIRELVLGGSEVPGSVGHLMSHHHLDPKRIQPWQRKALFRSVHWIARQLREETSIGKILNFVGEIALGLSPANRPQAPDLVLAMVVTLNNGIEATANRIASQLPSGFPASGRLASTIHHEFACPLFLMMGERIPLNLRMMEHAPEVRDMVEKSLVRSGVRSWFR